MIVTFIPAAGSARRMEGRDKLLATIGGEPILARTARIALGAGLGPVLVGLRPDDGPRLKALEGLDIEIVEVPDAAEGMAASLRAGAQAALSRIDAAKPARTGRATFAMMVLLPDMPEIGEADLKLMAEDFHAEAGSVIRAATADGLPGHPTILPENLLTRVGLLKGDRGAVGLLEGEPVRLCRLAGQRARLDLDTPEDWADWRRKTGMVK